MPTAYICEICHQSSQDITTWLMVSVQFVHNNPAITGPPGGRTLQSVAPDLMFDKLECRQAWCTQAGVTDPGPVPAALQGTPGPLPMGGPVPGT